MVDTIVYIFPFLFKSASDQEKSQKMCNVTFSSVDLNNINLDDNNFKDDMLKLLFILYL